MNHKYLIFDFDGVLGDTLEAGAKALQALYTPEKDLDYIKTHQFVEYHRKVPHHHFKTEQDAIDQKLVRQNLCKHIVENGYDMFDGFLKEITRIRHSKLAIVSGASEILLNDAVKNKTNLRFDYVMGIESSFSKVDRIKKICQNWGVGLDEIYFFTDTQSDIIELREILADDKVFGCAWGWHGYDLLKEVLPSEQILDQFDDIHRAIGNESLLSAEKYDKNIEKRIKKAERLAREEEAKKEASLEPWQQEILDREKGEQDIEEEVEAEDDNYEEIETEVNIEKKYVLLDSAGIRRPGQRTFGAESFATFKTIESAYQADVICMVVDGSQTLTHQDQVVAGIVKEAKKGVVVIVNKADLVDQEGRVRFVNEFNTKFNFLKVKKFVWVSANTGENIEAVWENIDLALEERSREITRDELRKLFNYLMKQKPPKKLRLQKRPVVYDLLYKSTPTPTFELLVKNKKAIHWSYLRFLENIIRRNFGYENTEIRVKAVNVDRKKVLG